VFWRDKPLAAGLVEEQEILVILKTPPHGLQPGGDYGETGVGVRVVKSSPAGKVLGTGGSCPRIMGPIVYSPKKVPGELMPIKKPTNEALVGQGVIDAVEAIGI
jgi:hypothetical protein